MRGFLALFLPAYGVTLTAVPIVMVIDHLGRGATLLHAVAVSPLWLIYTIPFALPFVAVASGIAALLQWLAEEWLRSLLGRVLFVLFCTGLGAAAVQLTIGHYGIVAATAGGVAAWLACSPSELPRTGIIITAGLASGMLLGFTYY